MSNLTTLEPVFSNLFLKNILKEESISIIKEKLSEYGKRQNIKDESIIYFFTKEILRRDLFFSINEEIQDQILFDSVFWASKEETKRKIRPNSYKDIKEEKKNAYFTQLQKFLIIALYNTELNKTDPFNFNIKLNKYIVTFFELSCVKRDRRIN